MKACSTSHRSTPSRNRDDLHVRKVAPQLHDGLYAFLFRHDYVRDDEVRPALAIELAPDVSVRCFDDLVTGLLKDPPTQCTDVGFVIYDQDARNCLCFLSPTVAARMSFVRVQNFSDDCQYLPDVIGFVDGGFCPSSESILGLPIC
jgi:hypothetical protein